MINLKPLAIYSLQSSRDSDMLGLRRKPTQSRLLLHKVQFLLFTVCLLLYKFAPVSPTTTNQMLNNSCVMVIHVMYKIT